MNEKFIRFIGALIDIPVQPVLQCDDEQENLLVKNFLNRHVYRRLSEEDFRKLVYTFYDDSGIKINGKILKVCLERLKKSKQTGDSIGFNKIFAMFDGFYHFKRGTFNTTKRIYLNVLPGYVVLVCEKLIQLIHCSNKINDYHFKISPPTDSRTDSIVIYCKDYAQQNTYLGLIAQLQQTNNYILFGSNLPRMTKKVEKYKQLTLKGVAIGDEPAGEAYVSDGKVMLEEGSESFGGLRSSLIADALEMVVKQKELVPHAFSDDKGKEELKNSFFNFVYKFFKAAGINPVAPHQNSEMRLLVSSKKNK